MVMHLRIDAPWLKQRGKCKDVEVNRKQDAFFGLEFGEEVNDLEPAVSFCNGADDGVLCPIRDECLIFALTNNEKWGVWGGTIPQTRKAMRKQWPLRSGKTPRPEWHFMTEKEAMDMLDETARAELQAEADFEEDE